MDKTMTVIQFVMACIMLACILIGVTAHIIKGNITSIIGYGVAFLMIYLIWAMTKLAYKEMRAEFKKNN